MKTLERQMIGLLLFSAALLAQSGGRFSGSVVPFVQGGRVVIEAAYAPALPADAALLTNKANWKLYRSQANGSKPVAVTIESIEDNRAFRALLIHVAGNWTDPEPANSYLWTALLLPPDGAPTLPLLLKSSPVASQTPTTLTKAEPSCAFCPPAPGKPADLSLTGNYLAGGNTKPIYKMEALGGYYPDKWTLLGFHLGSAFAIEVNQNAKPGAKKTTFDADSIVASVSLQRNITTPKSRFFDSIQFDESLPSGEFSRSVPSGNIIFRSSAMFVLKPWQPWIRAPRKSVAHRFYGTLYPVLAMEGGKNLNRPASLASQPIDLTRYNAIARGVLGADSTLGIATEDLKSDFLSLTGSYRVRLPAFDEPFIETLHGVTSVSLTTRARHWLEVDLNYAPFSFKYLQFTAQYQYGDLPPVFTLIDHKVSVGLTLKAIQSSKGTLMPAPIK